MVTQAAAWGKFELLDRQSELVNSDGLKDDLDPDLTAALRSTLEPYFPIRPNTRSGVDPKLGPLLRDILADIGVAAMDDLDTASLTEVLQGILE